MTSGMDDQPAKYGCSLKELRELMEHRSHEGYQKIQNDYGGVLELCKRLYTSPNEGTFLIVILKVCSHQVNAKAKATSPTNGCY